MNDNETISEHIYQYFPFILDYEFWRISFPERLTRRIYLSSRDPTGACIMAQMDHFMCTCSLTDLQWPPRARLLSHVKIPNFSIQKGARERPLCGRYVPSILTSAEPALVQARRRLLPDSQSGITSRKCGLRGRPRGFRVPFGTGPMTLV